MVLQLKRFVAGALLLSTISCSQALRNETPDARAAAILPAVVPHAGLPASNYIKHVVVVIQENRSFDNIFAGFPGADAPTYGRTHTGSIVPLRPTTFKSQDLGHGWWWAIPEWDKGKMDGFDVSPNGYTAQPPLLPYSYLERSQVAPYWSMARQYVLADRMFPTEMGPSFTAHLDLIAATSQISPTQYLINNPSTVPWGCDAPPYTYTVIINTSGATGKGPAPCFTQFATMADTLDAAQVSWKYYAPGISADWSGKYWSVFDSINNVRNGSDWAANVISPQTTVLSDIQNGNLAAVSWVVPDFKDSDHASSNSATGPSWVSSIVNAIGGSQYWNSTAIVVLWDDWGGWYDDVPPPQLDTVGLGIRVPCIIISPYAKAHYVSHTQYEFGSVLKFVEQVFGLPSLGATDVRANSIVDAFDFSRPARQFRTVSSPYSIKYFRAEKSSHKAPDDD